MARVPAARQNPLRLVEPSDSSAAKRPCRSARRKKVEQLTQELVDVLIEMFDLADGDPNREQDGDELEDSEGI